MFGARMKGLVVGAGEGGKVGLLVGNGVGGLVAAVGFTVGVGGPCTRPAGQLVTKY